MKPAWHSLARALVAALSPACFYDSDPSITDDPPATSTAATSSAASTTTTAHDASTALAASSTTELEPPDDTSSTGACAVHTWYLDADHDGYGATDQPTMACEAPPGYVAVDGDCAPTDPANAPGLLEVCDGQDNDCDALVDEYSPMNLACAGCRAVVGPESVYYLCSNTLTWPAARLACQGYGPGADLVTIHSKAEQDLLVGQISAVMSEAAGQWWLGLSDLALEGTFVWVDGTAIDFMSWLPGEPNQFEGTEEDCGEFSVGMPGLWNDLPCDAVSFYICEGPL